MEKVIIYIIMEIITLENGKMIIKMEKEFVFMLIKINMMEIGKKI